MRTPVALHPHQKLLLSDFFLDLGHSKSVDWCLIVYSIFVNSGWNMADLEHGIIFSVPGFYIAFKGMISARPKGWMESSSPQFLAAPVQEICSKEFKFKRLCWYVDRNIGLFEGCLNIDQRKIK